MMTKEISDFIRQRKALFWYTPDDKLDGISLSFLTETVLNYGSLDDVRELFAVAGVNNVAQAFRKAIQNSVRDNYYPEVKNFFSLYFNKYAHQSSK